MIISAKLWSAIRLQFNGPVTHMQPTLHMSMLVLYVLEPKSTSGARYQSVTTWTSVLPGYERLN